MKESRHLDVLLCLYRGGRIEYSCVSGILLLLRLLSLLMGFHRFLGSL